MVRDPPGPISTQTKLGSWFGARLLGACLSWSLSVIQHASTGVGHRLAARSRGGMPQQLTLPAACQCKSLVGVLTCLPSSDAEFSLDILQDVEEARQLLESEVDACQDLIGLEADLSKCKWPLLTLARLHRLQLDLPGADRPRLEQEVVTLFEQLIDVDPKRAGYYRDELAGKACIVLSRQC